MVQEAYDWQHPGLGKWPAPIHHKSPKHRAWKKKMRKSKFIWKWKIKDENKNEINTDASAAGAAAAASAAATVATTVKTVVKTKAAAEAAAAAPAAEASVLISFLFSSFIFHFHMNFYFSFFSSTDGTILDACTATMQVITKMGKWSGRKSIRCSPARWEKAATSKMHQSREK